MLSFLEECCDRPRMKNTRESVFKCAFVGGVEMGL